MWRFYKVKVLCIISIVCVFQKENLSPRKHGELECRSPTAAAVGDVIPEPRAGHVPIMSPVGGGTDAAARAHACEASTIADAVLLTSCAALAATKRDTRPKVFGACANGVSGEDASDVARSRPEVGREMSTDELTDGTSEMEAATTTTTTTSVTTLEPRPAAVCANVVSRETPTSAGGATGDASPAGGLETAPPGDRRDTLTSVATDNGDDSRDAAPRDETAGCARTSHAGRLSPPVQMCRVTHATGWHGSRPATDSAGDTAGEAWRHCGTALPPGGQRRNDDADQRKVEELTRRVVSTTGTIVVGEPVVTGSLDVKGTPVVTGRPVVTGTPDVTGTPVVTGTPDVTRMPVVTRTPGVTGTPVVTGTPDVTGTPVVSGRPDVTGTPVVTGTPFVTGMPVVTGKHDVTGTPIMGSAVR